MKPEEASRVLYIKLGESGAWWGECRSESLIRLGFFSGDPEVLDLIHRGDWDAVREYWKARRCGTPTAHMNQTRLFFEDDGSTLWVTFEEGYLFYGFSDGKDIIPLIGSSGEPCSVRRMPNGWSNVDANGNILRIDQLSGKLTRTAGYRQTICKFSAEAERYLRQRLSGRSIPEVEKAEASRRAFLDDLELLIKSLTWSDFEVLIELIFASSGWRRVSRTGGTQKTTDIDLENPVTGDKAFVQVKSETSQAQLQEYIVRRSVDKSDCNRMFYVYHSGKAATDLEDVTVWGSRDVAERVLANGLADWVILKAK